MEISIRQADPQARADVDGFCKNEVVASPQVDNGDNNNGSIQPGPSNISSRPKRKAMERFHRILRDNIDDL